MQKVAFFDIDGTVFRSSLLIELVRHLISRGVFPKEAHADFERAHMAWVNREGTYEAYIQGVITAFMKHIRGVHYGIFADVGKEVVAVQSNRVYRYTRDLVAELHSKGYYVIAVSGSPKTILDVFCASHGFDKVYGRLYEIGPDERFTGNVIDEALIADKREIVERVFREGFFTHADSVGVGDTDADISLLLSVAKPICFNPNMKLYEYAKKKGWSIVVERKDVIYTL